MAIKAFSFLSGVLFVSAVCAQSVPRSSHVWMITEENHSYEDVIGNRQMPYYNKLAEEYGLATQFYAEQHSSLPALMWLVAGGPVEPNNGTDSCHHHQDNVVRQLLKRGYTWRSYQEHLPAAGFQGVTSPDHLYYRRHNPLIDFSDVCPGTAQEYNSVPYAQMAADWADGATVNYAYITPDSEQDAHDGTLAAADQWLQAHVPEILARPEFQSGGDGILFIVWDEGTLYTDNRCSNTGKHKCGGRTATLVIGPEVKPGYQSTLTYHSANVLSTVCAVMGLSPCPGAAQHAAPMSDFFKVDSDGKPTNSVVISTPGNGATVTGSVHVIANASEDKPVSQTQVWDNGVKLGTYGTDIDAVYKLDVGPHVLTVLDLDNSYKVMHHATVHFKVETAVDGVQVISPRPNETIHKSTVHVVGHATESVRITQMQVWDNGVKLGWWNGADVNQYFNLAPGSHRVSVLDLDSNWNLIHETQVNYSVK